MRFFHFGRGGGKTHAAHRMRNDELPLCFVDREGNRYTTAVGAGDNDWWLGATIIMGADHAERLRNERGPFTEINPLTGEPVRADL